MTCPESKLWKLTSDIISPQSGHPEKPGQGEAPGPVGQEGWEGTGAPVCALCGPVGLATDAGERAARAGVGTAPEGNGVQLREAQPRILHELAYRRQQLGRCLCAAGQGPGVHA